MVSPEFKSFGFTVKSVEAFRLITDEGKVIDFSGSAMTAGYKFVELPIATVSSLVFKTDANRELTEKLKAISSFEKVAYTNSGTEACDMALSRYNSTIISFEGSYHGRSYLTYKVSNGKGIDAQNRIIHLKFPDSTIEANEAISLNYGILEEAKEVLPLEGSVIIMELIQSDGGENVVTQEFIDFLNEIVGKYKMHLIIDEVYTGAGRSGELVLSNKFDIKPDMICLGKGIAAGLPMGIILYNGDWNLPTENGALGMLGGNDMACKAAISVLNSLTEKRLQFVRSSGKEIIRKISNVNNKRIKDVRGLGFMIGVEFVDLEGNSDTRYAYQVRDELAKRHLACGLVGENNNILKITPPVLIDEDTLNEGVGIIEEVLGELLE